jgi:hypothetical protein
MVLEDRVVFPEAVEAGAEEVVVGQDKNTSKNNCITIGNLV